MWHARTFTSTFQRPAYGMLGHSQVHFSDQHVAFTSTCQRPACGMLGHSQVHFRDQHVAC